jgi:16S rRNA (guanine527-N7)-methyltransferase
MPTDGEQTRELLSNALGAQCIDLSEKTGAAFALYADMLVDWNTNRLNLTRLITPEQIAVNHFLDSITITQFVKIPYQGKLIDIGTGAGFPGLALKIYRPDLSLVLIESTAKKLSFCRAVSEQLGLKDVEFVHGRAEDPLLVRRFGGAGSVVTARAVAQLSKLLGWAEPLIAQSGVFVAWKGSRVHEEVAAAEKSARLLALTMQVEEQKLSVPNVESVVNYYVVCRRTR